MNNTDDFYVVLSNEIEDYISPESDTPQADAKVFPQPAGSRMFPESIQPAFQISNKPDGGERVIARDIRADVSKVLAGLPR